MYLFLYLSFQQETVLKIVLGISLPVPQPTFPLQEGKRVFAACSSMHYAERKHCWTQILNDDCKYAVISVKSITKNYICPCYINSFKPQLLQNFVGWLIQCLYTFFNSKKGALLMTFKWILFRVYENADVISSFIGIWRSCSIHLFF